MTIEKDTARDAGGGAEMAGLMAEVLEALAVLPERFAARLGGEKGWLSVAEAAVYGGYTEKFIRDQIREKRLAPCGKRRGIRIHKAHLDTQILLGFPVLDIGDPAEEVQRALAGPAISDLLPRPKKNKPADVKLLV